MNYEQNWFSKLYHPFNLNSVWKMRKQCLVKLWTINVANFSLYLSNLFCYHYFCDHSNSPLGFVRPLSQVVCGKENGLKMNFHQKPVNNRIKTLHEIP